MKMNDKVIIAWICPGEVDNLFAMRIAAIFRERRDRVVDLMCDENSGLLSRGRNQVVANFLKHPEQAEWLLMIDADQQLFVEHFDKLIETAHDKERPIVAGLYFGAWGGDFYPTPMPLIFKEHPTRHHRYVPLDHYPRDTVIPIDSAGTGCLLVHRSVFEKIAEAADDHETTHYVDGTSEARWCWFRDLALNGDWYSEDHYFCHRARVAGFNLVAHTGVVLPHRKKYWLEEKHHMLSHPDMLTPEEVQHPMWAALGGKVPPRHDHEPEPETTEAQPAPERAVKPRPVKRKPVRR